MPSEKSTHEAERLGRLREYAILDTLAEEAFDRITRLAAQLLGTPVALITFIDEDRQWFKSGAGAAFQSIPVDLPREMTFCHHAIQHDEVMVITDAKLDERFRNFPFVSGGLGVRFYAGAPLRSPDGYNLGTLCVVDTEVRSMDDVQRGLLADLAAIVVDELELRELAVRARRAEDRLMDAVGSLPAGFVLYDSDDRLVLANPRYREIYSNATEVIQTGAYFADIIRGGVERGQCPDAVGREEEWISERLRDRLNPGAPFEQQLPGDRWLRIQECRTRDGGMVGFGFDITELKRQRRELTRLAWTDSLTGALNRHRFMELAETEIARSARDGARLSMLLIDADYFKTINDRYGHAAGDQVLVELVARWKKCLGSKDILGRIGGEEFCILLPDIEFGSAMALAEQLRAAVQDLPFAFRGQLLRLSVSIGMTQCLGAGDTLAAMLERADRGLYTAKDGGRNRLVNRSA